VAGPLRAFWRLVAYGPGERPPRRRIRWRVPAESAAQASATIFLVLRRMRWPLITVIVIFAVSTIGLTFIPGRDADGSPNRMSIFHSFYVVSYTATTIGFGELPDPFTDAQRLWVTVTIYLSVVGWAYTIGSLLTLLQDRSFRRALALQHFTRKVARLREPFLLIAGYGQTGRRLGRTFDSLGRQFVVLDAAEENIEALDLEAYRFDVPGLAADARNPDHLGIAGLGHFACEAVLAMTNDDEVNLAVTMAVALLRPDLPVIARTVSPDIEHRMRAFGTPTVVNPFDRFGDHLRIALRAPASYQLLTWLESGPGAPLPRRADPPAHGHWVVCGYGRFGREVTHDLRAEGYHVTVVEPGPAAELEPGAIVGRGEEAEVLEAAGIDRAAGFIAGTDNDTTNLSLVVAAHGANPGLFVAARQNKQSSASLFAAVDVNALLVPAEVVAHEVYAQLATPLLWRFLREMPARGDAWADRLIGRLTHLCGKRLQSIWKLQLNVAEAPSLRGVVEDMPQLGDLLRSPDDREERLEAVVLLVVRGDETYLAPPDDFPLALDDELLLVGDPAARRLLDSTLLLDAVREYVLRDRHVPSSWIWRVITGNRA